MCWQDQSNVNNKYRYNGKEFIDLASLGWYDYGARYYEPRIGRFTTVDPLAEEMPEWGTYSYAYDNPVAFTDPFGMAPQSIEELVNTVWEKGEGTYDNQGNEVSEDESSGPGPFTLEGLFNRSRHLYDRFRAWETGDDSYLDKWRTQEEIDKILLTEAALLLTGGYAVKIVIKGGKLVYTISKGQRLIKTVEVASGVSSKTINLRADIILSGGRSGQLVKTLTGPKNSVLKGSKGRIFITDDAGRVIWDITKTRAKQVIPGKGFGSKLSPTPDQLNLLKRIWGN